MIIYLTIFIIIKNYYAIENDLQHNNNIIHYPIIVRYQYCNINVVHINYIHII